MKPVVLAMLALLGIVVAGNFPPDSAEAAPRRIYGCIEPPTLELMNKRDCADGIGFSWSRSRPSEWTACMVNKTRKIVMADLCGRGKSQITWGNYSATKKYLTACVDRRTKKMFVALRGQCGAKMKIRWVKSAPYLPITTTTTVIDSTTTSSSTTTTTIVPSCANGLAECLYGDTGPGGGTVFYVDMEEEFDWDYLEAAPVTWADGELMNWTCSAEYSTVITTGTEIGDGRTNTLNMYNAQQVCGGGLLAGVVVPALEFGGKSDWFIPSLDELVAMSSQNTALGLGLDESIPYWSSSQSPNSADMAFSHDVGTSTTYESTKGGGNVRPIRAFGPDCAWGGVCELGDIGPGGGRVFYIDSADEFAEWTYMEMAPSNWYGGSELTGPWCSNDTSTEFGATAYGIGSGVTNFAIMTANCTGVADTVDEYGSEYLGLRLDDWFIPSNDEMNTAYSVLVTLGHWTGSNWYWTSTELYDNARVLVPAFGHTASTLKDAGSVGVIPIRAF